jgi:hypothetical protein
LLDVLGIEFDSHRPKIGQPENWLIGKTPWKRLRSATLSDLAIMRANVEDDSELFRGYDSWITHEEVLRRPPTASLALVRASGLRWGREIDFNGRYRVVGHFKVGDQGYRLPLTDPIWKQKLLGMLGNTLLVHENSFGRPNQELFLTLSLGDLFQKTGSHYKLIAGVVEIQR